MKRLVCAVSLGMFCALSAWGLDLPRPSGYVTDRAGVMAGAGAQVEQVLAGLERSTGAQIALVTVRSLEGEEIAQAANELFTSWRVGQQGTDNGLLILFSLEDRKIRFEVGYGLESVITDMRAGAIQDRMLPYFKEDRYAEGLFVGVVDAASLIARSAGVELQLEPGSMPAGAARRPRTVLGTILRLVFFGIMALLFIRNPFLFLLFLGMSGGRGGFGGGGFGGGGFGGFGGGMSGGGGAGRSW